VKSGNQGGQPSRQTGFVLTGIEKKEYSFNHEIHENTRKMENFYPQMSQMDTDEKHEGGIPGFMGRVRRLGGPSLCISPLATNASPLDHARRAAGGE